MSSLSRLELVEEEERHTRMRLDAAKSHLLEVAEEERAHHETLLEELEREWRTAAQRLHAARGHES